MTNLKPKAPLEVEVCGVATTTLTSVSTSLSRFDAGLAAKVVMRMRDLNKIFIVHVAPQELRSQSRLQVGTVNDPIPPQIGQTAASKIGAGPDSEVVKILHRVVQALESAAANARISAEVPDLPRLHPLDLSPHRAPLLGRLASISVVKRLRAAVMA